MVAKLKSKIVKSPFLWIGIVLFAFVVLFSFQKKRQLERDTERNIQLMVRNISSNNIDIAKGIFNHYHDQLEYMSYLDLLKTDTIIDYFATKDTLYRDIAILDKLNGQSQIGIKSTFGGSGGGYIEFVEPIRSNGDNRYISLQISLQNLHRLIAENSNFSYSYISIIKDGRYLYHPDEIKIGEVVDSMTIENIRTHGQKNIFESFSEYLNIPVYSYVDSISMNEEIWYLTSNTPGVSFDSIISNIRNTFLYISIAASIAFAFIFLFGFMIWKKEFVKKQALLQDKIDLELQNEQHKKQMLITELEQLKSGLNPHFLFNSLSSLRILVTKNPDEAKAFATSLSNLYRYLLRQQSMDQISLEEELQFTKEYIYLQKIRFGDRVMVDIDVAEETLMCRVPPVSVQLLVENCIKHTKMTASNPLFISISIKDECIVVKNNYNPININSPSGKGLLNLTKRYSYLTDKLCSFVIQNNEFVSKIPLL